MTKMAVHYNAKYEVIFVTTSKNYFGRYYNSKDVLRFDKRIFGSVENVIEFMCMKTRLTKSDFTIV